MPDFRSEFERHALEETPREACGLLVSGTYRRCRNIADDPEQDFVLHPKDYLLACAAGKIEAVIHSHPMGGGASIQDQKACKHLGLPWYIWSMPENEWSTIDPC